MKMKGIFVIGIIFAIIAFSFMIISSEDISSMNLIKGKNHVELNVSNKFYAETLIKLNPDIEAISYKEDNETIGYANVFGGVGKNFVVESRTYEIIVKENTNLILPD